MEKQRFSIPNISCGHCVMAIPNELGALDGVQQVSGDPNAKEIVVAWEHPATLERIRAALQEINYPAD